MLSAFAQQVPDEVVRSFVERIHQGACPHCQRVGAVDVYTVHSVWSALFVVKYQSEKCISCLSCGRKARLKAMVSSFFLGWWSVPVGLVVTPVQIGRNLWGLVQRRSSSVPSPQLERSVRLMLATELNQRLRRVSPMRDA